MHPSVRSLACESDLPLGVVSMCAMCRRPIWRRTFFGETYQRIGARLVFLGKLVNVMQLAGVSGRDTARGWRRQASVNQNQGEMPA